MIVKKAGEYTLKKYVSILLFIFLVGFNPLIASAKATVLPANIKLVGDAKELSFSEEVFLSEDAMLPGGSIERILTIENRKNVPFKLDFYVERVYQDESEHDLLEMIQVEFWEDDTLLCSGTIDNHGCMEKTFYAVLNPGNTRTIKAIATMSPEAGNEYKNKFAQYDWVFEAVVTKIPTTGEPTGPIIIPPTGDPLVDTGLFSLEMAVLGCGLVISGRLLLGKRRNDSQTDEK